jgi:Shedu protein SduA, C-terminal
VTEAHTNRMGEQKVSQRGIPYVTATLKQKARTVTQAALWKITHRSGQHEIHLKLGRYSLVGGKHPEVGSPKSELTLDAEELDALLKTLEENLEPFRAGARKWVTLDRDLGPEQVEQLRRLFANPDKRQLIDFLTEHDIVPSDLVKSLDFQKRCRAVAELESMLGGDLAEQRWQDWFTENNWVLGSDFVRILDERPIDVNHIADYLMQAYDGFLDLVEIKRPEGGLKFWADSRDHANYVPHPDLVKAITQAIRYIFEVERETNSIKFLQRLGGVRAIKPRCVLIYGRSSAWNEEQREAYRILNAGYHNLTILTFDHVLQRAKRMLGLEESGAKAAHGKDRALDDIPF